MGSLTCSSNMLHFSIEPIINSPFCAALGSTNRLWVRKIFTARLNDPALFHVILLCAAVHLHFVNSHLLPIEVAYHKLKAIQSVNERLRDSPTAISDHTIHAVMLMVLSEASSSQALSKRLSTNYSVTCGVLGVMYMQRRHT